MLLVGGVFIFWDDIFPTPKDETNMITEGKHNEVYKDIEKDIDSLDHSPFELTKLSTIHTQITQSESNNLIDKNQSELLIKKLVAYYAPKLTAEVEAFFISNATDVKIIYDLHTTMKDIKSRYSTDKLNNALNLTYAYYNYTNYFKSFDSYKNGEFSQTDMDQILSKFKDLGNKNPIIGNYKDFKEKYNVTKVNWIRFTDIKNNFDFSINRKRYNCEDYREYEFYYKECERLKAEYDNSQNLNH